MATLKWKTQWRMGCATRFSSCLLIHMWEDLCLGSDSIPPSFLPHDLVPSTSCILYLPGPQESWRPFLPFYTTSKPTKLFALDSLIPFFSQRGRKRLKVTVQKRGNAGSLLFPSAMLSLSADLHAYVLSILWISVSVSVLFPTSPEAGEALNEPKVWFWVEMPRWDWNYL